MNNFDLSIIIVEYNSYDYLYNCIKSIQKQCRDISYEIIVVDNNEKKDNEANIKELEEKNITIVKAKKNNGFGVGNNLGAEYASGKYLLLLNPDTIVKDNSIKKMLDFIKKHNEIGALSCLLYQEDEKKLQRYFYGKFQNFFSVTFRRYNYRKIDYRKKFFYTDIVTGACLMIKRSLFKKLNGFDEKFFMYLEDDDLCKRISDLGYKNAVLNTARIVHLEGKSSTNKEKKEYYYKSQNYYWEKHNGKFVTNVMKILRFPYKKIRTIF